ncbi:hypothetical protein B296_00019568 [Ensete ventricosum]|uniref:Uncharacterized protein n=1 Tax=Ensete ventricosum TaxID=4639 RepID=A0A426ZLV9_ENSVE|nr:hypothetical protein B296_00019568 [Ensete ventricosum]
MAVPHTSQLSCDAGTGWNRHPSPPSSPMWGGGRWGVDLRNPGNITARQLWSCATTPWSNTTVSAVPSMQNPSR